MPIVKTQKKDETLSLSKISTKHQVTIPQEVFEELQLKIGDLVEIVAERGKATLVPKRVVSRPLASKLSAREQKTLQSAQKKIEAINKNILTSKGLTPAEADVAVKIGLINHDQKYWWLEEWQEGEREVERDIKAGRVSGPFETAENLLAHLHQL
ncbi:MAG: AbrB/MazE/SpoVT family DNA-binding domain-containing protein [bacterium]|nr:AbrB/MazE/SpoVT family DNA-binding domain-containing protein [bacterium]